MFWTQESIYLTFKIWRRSDLRQDSLGTYRCSKDGETDAHWRKFRRTRQRRPAAVKFSSSGDAARTGSARGDNEPNTTNNKRKADGEHPETQNAKAEMRSEGNTQKGTNWRKRT